MGEHHREDRDRRAHRSYRQAEERYRRADRDAPEPGREDHRTPPDYRKPDGDYRGPTSTFRRTDRNSRQPDRADDDRPPTHDRRPPTHDDRQPPGRSHHERTAYDEREPPSRRHRADDDHHPTHDDQQPPGRSHHERTAYDEREPPGPAYRADGSYRDSRAARPRRSRSQTVRSRSRRSRSQTVRSRTTARGRYYQLPANLTAPTDPAPAGGSRARHRLARARHNLARAGYRVVRPRGGNGRLPTPIEALLPWGPVLVGIGILIGLMISVFVVPASQVSPPGLPDLALPPGAPNPTQSPPDQPDEGPRYLVPEAYEVQYSPTPAEPSSPPPPPPPEAELTGTYRLEEIHQGVFIAAVKIVNESAVAGGWTVELAYGRDVGRLNTFWVDGTPQQSLERAEDRLVFTNAVDLPPQSSVALKVHFDKFGFDISPRICLVNGENCVIDDDRWPDHGW